MNFNAEYRQADPRLGNKVRTWRGGEAGRHSRPMSTRQDHPATASSDPFGLREGEVAVAPPERFDASLYFIGQIRTPWTRREDCPKNGRETEAVCTVELDSRWAQGLRGLE